MKRHSQWKGDKRDPMSFPSTPTPALTRSRWAHTRGRWDKLVSTELTEEVQEIHDTLSEKDHLLTAFVTACTQPSEVILHNFYLLFLPYLIKKAFIHPVSLNYPLPQKGQFRLTFQFESSEIYLWSARASKPAEKVSKSEGKKNPVLLILTPGKPNIFKTHAEIQNYSQSGFELKLVNIKWMVLQYVKDILGGWYDLPKPALVNWSQESQGPSCSTKPHQALWVLLHPAERLGLQIFGLVQGFRNLKEFLRYFFQQKFFTGKEKKGKQSFTWCYLVKKKKKLKPLLNGRKVQKLKLRIVEHPGVQPNWQVLPCAARKHHLLFWLNNNNYKKPNKRWDQNLPQIININANNFSQSGKGNHQFWHHSCKCVLHTQAKNGRLQQHT